MIISAYLTAARTHAGGCCAETSWATTAKAPRKREALANIAGNKEDGYRRVYEGVGGVQEVVIEMKRPSE